MQNQYLHNVKVFKFDNGALRLYHLLETYRPWKENESVSTMDGRLPLCLYMISSFFPTQPLFVPQPYS